MDSCKLDVLGNGIGDNLSIACHCIHLNLLGVLDELAYHHRVVLTDIGSQFEELFKFFLVGAHVHRSSREHV